MDEAASQGVSQDTDQPDPTPLATFLTKNIKVEPSAYLWGIQGGDPPMCGTDMVIPC